jgi:hypothetical protein
VKLAPEKSTLFPCVRKSIRVCDQPAVAMAAAIDEKRITLSNFIE